MSDQPTRLEARDTDGPAVGRPGLDRRHALAGAAGLGLAVPLLAACGEDESSTSTGSDSSGSSGSAGNGGSGGPIAETSEVEVGGGTILTDPKVVLTQPEDGTFKAFDTTCTHKGCAVSSIEDGTIVCPCHGSQFSITDGSVEQGPATDPLTEVPITVKGGRISLG